jgi:hypothetical protein
MAALHEALRALAPADFSEVPNAPEELDTFLADIFDKTQLIIDTIPIASPDASSNRPRAHTTAAGSSSEMTASSARTEPPPPDRQALQKEWGKPMKLGAKENQMGISVYKAGGKDSRGAWFARRSVHEGLGFARFKAAFEKEFPTSLAVQGAPGEGNIRGIGAETHIEDITAPNAGKVDVYRLTAQFPGPTTPREFVTLLLTSSKALKPQREGQLIPRHYMIVSKPCNHPEAPQRDGFIRGQYESVEFIREIPRKLTTSTSTTDLTKMGHKHPHNMEQDVLIHNAERHLQPHEDSATQARSREPSPASRKRSHTVGVPDHESASNRASFDGYDPEENPVEWIMVTRSDPGGSVPRFMVERGTPASICADAVKFLDWACQQDDSAVDTPDTPSKPHAAFRRESYTSFTRPEKFPDIAEESSAEASDVPTTTITDPTPTTSQAPGGGLFASVTGAISAYAPQAVLNHFPYGGQDAAGATSASVSREVSNRSVNGDDDDASSTLSSLSFASADSHLSRIRSQPSSALSPPASPSLNRPQTQHEKDLAKLEERRAALDAKHAATLSKIKDQAINADAKEAAALKKAEEKHEREVRKQEARYKREMEKLEARRLKDEKKREAQAKKQSDKDEKEALKRERDELKEKLAVVQHEAELWIRQVGDLQRENTRLMARIGRLEGKGGAAALEEPRPSMSRQQTGVEGGSRSRTPTPMVTGSAPPAEKGSEESLKKFSNRVRTATLNSLGITPEGGGNGGNGGEGIIGSGVNRSRSSSLFKRSRDKDREGQATLDKASLNSEKASVRSGDSSKVSVAS